MMSEPVTRGRRQWMIAGRPVGLLVLATTFATGGLAILALLPDSQAELSLRGAVAAYALGVGGGLLTLTRVGWWIGVATTGLIAFVACSGVIWGLFLFVAAGPFSSSVVEPIGVAVVTAACAVRAYDYLWGSVRALTR
jgi:hypothetical protein